jgi:hypothetical protein
MSGTPETAKTADLLAAEGIMDVDSPKKWKSLALSTPCAVGLPFPGRLVDGMHTIVHHELWVPLPYPFSVANVPLFIFQHQPPESLSAGTLRELCDAFHLPITRIMAKLRDRLQEFSANRKEWEKWVFGYQKKTMLAC